MQAEYLYSGYNVQADVLSATGTNGYHSMQYGDLNAVFNQVLGSRSRTDFGVNAGVGVSLRLFGGPLRLYAEGRYHYI